MAAPKTYAELQFESQMWKDLIKKVKGKWDDVAKRKQFGDVIAPTIYGDIMEHFEKESGPDGRWKAWSVMYTKHMKSIGKGGNKILQDKGRLRQSFTPSKWKAKPEGILFVNAAKTKGGFPYAAAHDIGGPKLPKRSFMWLSSKGMVRMIKVVEAWLNPESKK